MATFQNEFIFKLLDKISPQLKKIERQMAKTTSKIRNSARKINFSFKGIAGGFKKLGTGILSKAKKMAFSIQTLKKGILALGAGATASSIAFASLEIGLVNVQNLLSNEDILKYTDRLKAMQKEGIKAGFSIESTNKALFDTISALGASEAGFNAFDQAQKLAIAGVTDLSIAVDGITSIVNAYGRETTSATEVANAFFTAQKAGKTTVAQLSASIGQLAPIAKSAGVGFEEALSAVSALTLGGLSTDEAVTSLKGAFTALIKPTDDAKKMLEAMEIPFGAANIEALGLSKTLLALTRAQKKFGTDAIAQAIPNIRAFTAITALSEDKLKILDKTILQINEDIKNGTGLNEAYARVNDTMSKKFSKATGSVKVLAGTVGETFNKQVKQGLDLITNLSNKTEQFTQRKFITQGQIQALDQTPMNQSFSSNTMINSRNKTDVSGNIAVEILSAEKTKTKMSPAKNSPVGFTGKNTIIGGSY